MTLQYKTHALERACTDYSQAKRDYGEQMAHKLHQRVKELSAASGVDQLLQYGIGRCHELKGDRKGDYAMDLSGMQRLIFRRVESVNDAVFIISIEDYH